MTRTATAHRTTKETEIEVALTIEGSGTVSASTGIPFFDHMLEQLGKHAGFDLVVAATGDLEVDTHHTIEDVGIVIGGALKDALGDKVGVRRFASGSFPLDEALVLVALDLSGRPFLVVRRRSGLGVDRYVRPAARRGVLARLRVCRRPDTAPAIRRRPQRAPRDRSIIQRGRSLPPRRGSHRERRPSEHQGRAIDLYPAIDLRGGNAVRLLRGDFAAETVYDADPVAVARDFEAQGARWIHVVDLDAARSGTAANLTVIEAICAAVSCRVQSGGGVRSIDAAGALLGAGVARVVVGTAAVEQPEFVAALCRLHPGHVAVGLDAHGRNVAVRGWVEGSGRDLVAMAEEFASVGVAALIVTEIGRDGTLEGPDVEQLGAVLESTSIPVIASGGVGSLEDLDALGGLRSGDRVLAGVIAGRALYERRFTVRDGLARLASYGNSARPPKVG